MRYVVMLLGLTCGLSTACRNLPGRAGTEVRVNVEGSLQLLPFETTADFSLLKVAVVDPGTLITNPDAEPLAVADVDATQCANANVCPFLVPGVPISSTSGLGLALQIIDQRAAGSQAWPPLYTGIALDSTVSAAVKAKTDIGGCAAVVVTAAGFGKIATGAGKAADDLIARGSMVGLVLGKPSEATMTSQGVPPAVAGVTVSAAADSVTMAYPNDDLSASSSATGALGLFVMTSSASRVELTSLKFSTADATRTWKDVESESVGSLPKHLLFLEFQADN